MHAGSVLKTIFWDTCGQERYRSIAHNFFRGAHAVVVVYDVTDADSFVDVDKWIRDLDESTGGGDGNQVRLLLGNKSESHRRIVDADTAAGFASHRGFAFLEVSARTGANVEQAYAALAAGIVERAAEATRLRPPKGDLPDPGRGGRGRVECCTVS